MHSDDFLTNGGKANGNSGENPADEAFIFKHFYNNKKGLIKQHIKEEKEAIQLGGIKKNFYRYTMPFCHFTGYNLWLLKPTKLNRGRGIHVINNLTQLKSLIARYCEGWYKPAAPNKANALTNEPKNDNIVISGAANISTPQAIEQTFSSPEKAGTDDELNFDMENDDTESVEKGSPEPATTKANAPDS